MRVRDTRVAQIRPDLVLLDYSLPDLPGDQVCERLLRNETTAHIPVVVLTSSREEIQMVETYQLGVNSYVVKPTDSKQFAQLIGDVGYYWLSVNQRPQR